MKMYCVVARSSLEAMGGNRGKMMAQAGHAYLHAYLDAYNRFTHEALDYMKDKATKVTLIVDTVEELETLHEAYSTVCGVSLVKDAGKTVFPEPTVTCLGIGPIHEDMVGEDIRALKVLI